jgi:hypothetical protein
MSRPDLTEMSTDELRQVAASLYSVIEAREAALRQQNQEIHWKDLKIAQLTHEMAILKRWRFGKAAEAFHGLQRSLLEESIDEDLGAIEVELDAVRETPRRQRVPVRAHLPVGLPRVEIRHEPETTVCGCGCPMKRIGEDVAEKLDYLPGTFQVERHIRGKWVCGACETIVQAPVAIGRASWLFAGSDRAVAGNHEFYGHEFDLQAPGPSGPGEDHPRLPLSRQRGCDRQRCAHRRRDLLVGLRRRRHTTMAERNRNRGFEAQPTRVLCNRL